MSHPLELISIASPCKADWAEMTGTEQVRFCGDCKLNVYNLSGMSREAAEALVQSTEGRLCVRYFRREDGTIITRDCPVGLQALHRGKLTRFGRVAAAVTIVTVMGAFCVSNAESLPGKQKPISSHQSKDTKPALMGKPMMGEPLMGDMAFPINGKPPQVIKTAKPPKTSSKQPKPPEHTMGAIAPSREIMGRMKAPEKPPEQNKPAPSSTNKH